MASNSKSRHLIALLEFRQSKIGQENLKRMIKFLGVGVNRQPSPPLIDFEYRKTIDRHYLIFFL